MKRSYGSLLVASLLLVPLTGATAFASDSPRMIAPGSAQAAQPMTELDCAARIDRLNAQSYSGSDDSTAGSYYYQKAREAEALARDIRADRPVSGSDVRHALDTSHVIRYLGD